MDVSAVLVTHLSSFLFPVFCEIHKVFLSQDIHCTRNKPELAFVFILLLLEHRHWYSGPRETFLLVFLVFITEFFLQKS